MRLPTYAFAAVFSFIASGCFVTPGPGPDPDPSPGTVYNPPPQGQPSPQLDAAQYLGLRAMLGYRVRAGASAALPDGDLGYVVTANGQGGYRVTWTDTYGTTARFSGSISTDGSFDPAQLQKFSGYENLYLSDDLRTVYFDSVPGAALDGVDVVSSTDPIYLDATVDGSHQAFGIYFS